MISIALLVFKFLNVKSALNRFASGTSPDVLSRVASNVWYSSSEAERAAGDGILNMFSELLTRSLWMLCLLMLMERNANLSRFPAFGKILKVDHLHSSPLELQNCHSHCSSVTDIFAYT